MRHSVFMEEAIPVLRIVEAAASISWYQRLGYIQEWEYRFEPGFPTFASLARNGGARLFLSEHTGDAKPDALVCLRVNNLEDVAHEFQAEIHAQPWGREVHLVDPDGNRLRLSDSARND
jgi:hypothetical protein